MPATTEADAVRAQLAAVVEEQERLALEYEPYSDAAFDNALWQRWLDEKQAELIWWLNPLDLSGTGL